MSKRLTDRETQTAVNVLWSLGYRPATSKHENPDQPNSPGYFNVTPYRLTTTDGVILRRTPWATLRLAGFPFTLEIDSRGIWPLIGCPVVTIHADSPTLTPGDREAAVCAARKISLDGYYVRLDLSSESLALIGGQPINLPAVSIENHAN